MGRRKSHSFTVLLPIVSLQKSLLSFSLQGAGFAAFQLYLVNDPPAINVCVGMLLKSSPPFFFLGMAQPGGPFLSARLARLTSLQQASAEPKVEKELYPIYLDSQSKPGQETE